MMLAMARETSVAPSPMRSDPVLSEMWPMRRGEKASPSAVDHEEIDGESG